MKTVIKLSCFWFKTLCKENKIKISNQDINFILEKSKNRLYLKNELIKIKRFCQKKIY